jgi:ribonucleoside-diphosphate reductase alpha chain
MQLNLDNSRDSLLTEFGKYTLKDRYLLPGESYQEGFARAAMAYSEGDMEFAQRIYDYASKLWFMFSSPILSNGGTKRGLPISCFLSYVPDSREGILDHYTENGWLTSMGGGIGSYWGHLRSDGAVTSTGGRSTGIIPFIHTVDSQMLAFSQGTTRRGSYAAYLDISHPEIEEFLNMRKETGGDVHRKNINLNHGVNITDKFMRAVHEGSDWDLIDPHTKDTVKKVSARYLWQTLLELRVGSGKGQPYLHFIDTTNKFLPQCQKNTGLEVYTSNLCTEIVLPTSEERTAVCCLSSVNLNTFDEWKTDARFIPDLIRFLDNVLEAFIQAAPKSMKKAVYSASQERSIGLGAMGFHSYLQQKNIPFEGPLAVGINREIFKKIKMEAEQASKALGREKGFAPDYGDEWRSSLKVGPEKRNVHLIAIAPNATSSIICGGVSPSIEPYAANAFTQKTMSGSALFKNPYLCQVLQQKNLDTDEIWSSIITNKGSVQHLDGLDEWEKKVFKTAYEIDQHWVVEHAAHRQPFIDQAQSVNLFFNNPVDAQYLHDVHWAAWEKGLKTLYYARPQAAKHSEVVAQKVERKIRPDADECLSCEG